MNLNRRDLLAGIGTLSAGLILTGCSNAGRLSPAQAKSPSSQGQPMKNGEVTAVEDLMREHGILRRALFIYSESAAKLRAAPTVTVTDSLQKTARLFRDFGEEYHEKQLEETYIFPAVKTAGPSQAVAYVDILIAQHRRGREITDYILATTKQATVKGSDAAALANAMDAFVRMYRPHAAREDTVVFPAWKDILSAEKLDEMGDKFEDIEHRLVGADGFENTVRQIAAIEAELGMADLAQFTAQPLTV